jgi:hypothetical protein
LVVSTAEHWPCFQLGWQRFNVLYQGTGKCRRICNEELRDLYFLPDIVRVIKSKRMRWAGYVAGMGERRSAYKVFIGKPEGKSPRGKLRLTWKNDIKMDL